MNVAPEIQPEAPVPKGWRFFLFASPQLALATLGLPIVIYLPAYYAGPLGLGLTATGLIFMLTRFWDVLTDGLFGWAVDRFPTRWGRRKIWILVSTPLMAISALAICFPPEGAGAAYLAFWLFFIYIWWTLIHICHIAWAAELSDDYDERSAIQGRVLAVYFTGLLLVLTAPIVAGALIGESGLQQKLEAMGVYTAILLPMTVAACLLVARERPAPPRRPQGTETSWGDAMRLVVANPALLRVLGVDLLAGLSNGIASGLFVYVTAELFRLQGMTVAGVPIDPGIFLLLTFVGALLGVPLWLRLSYRVGKHRAVAGSALLNIAAFATVLLIPPGAWGLFALFYLASGIAFGAPPFLDRAILADVVDLDRTKTGEQRTGLFFALMSMTNKIGYALPVGLLFPALALAGFDPNGANDPQALAALAAMFVGFPILCNLAIVALMWRFPIDREAQARLRASLGAVS
jgi:Na+/melibiose symporter-like transporter